MVNNEKLFKEYTKNKQNTEIRNEIVLNNMGLVPYTINRYNLYVEGIHDYEEMLQDGYIALINAIETFDSSLGFKFSTYAIKCILALTSKRLEYHKDLSLDAPLKSSDEEDTFLIDTIEDDKINIEREIIDQQFYSSVRKNLSLSLDTLELNVIKAFYGIGQEMKNYEQISSTFNLDIKTIRNIKNKAESKIRNTKYFRMLYLERNPISYYPSLHFENEKTGPTNKIVSPVENITLKKLQQERSLFIKTLKTLKKDE